MNDSTIIDPKVFKIADFGLAACYFSSEIYDDKEIKYVNQLIKSYKDGLQLKDPTKLDKNLFEPRIYKLWGHFSNACLVPVDDYNFSSRIFQPFSHLVTPNPYSEKSFIYQTQTYILPDLRKNDTESVFDCWTKTKDHDFIGIINIKLNDELVEGIGTQKLGEFIELVNKHIPLPGKTMTDDNVVFFPSFSFSWNELTLYLFSNDLFELNKKLVFILGLPMQVDKTGNKKTVKAVEFSQSVFGFKYKADHTYSFKKQNGTHFNMRLFLKQGCLSNGIDFIINNLKINPQFIKLIVGKGDIALLNLDINSFFHVFKGLIDYYKSKIDLEEVPIFSKTYTTVFFDLFDDIKKEPITYEIVNNQTKFSHEKINLLYRALKRQRVPNSLRDRFVKLYIKYNHAVNDNVMGKYFMSLDSVLNKKMDEIINDKIFHENDLSIFSYSELLMRFSEQMEKAFFNRYGSSYDMDEVPDWNIDFSGGYQQLIMAYDYAYKSITQLFGEGESDDCPYPYSFMFLSSHSGPKSNSYSVRLNTFHIYHPELFANTAVHEAINFLWQKLSIKEIQYVQILKEIDNYLGYNNDYKVNLEESESKFFRYLYCDYATLLTVFPNNFDGFTIWLFSTILSDPAIYDQYGNIESEIITNSLVRFLMIYTIDGQTTQLNNHYDSFFSTIPQIYIVWIQKKDFLLKLVNHILQQFDFQYGITIIKKIVLSEIENEIIYDDKIKVSDLHKKLLRYIKNKAKHIEAIVFKLEQGEIISKELEKIKPKGKACNQYNATSLLGALLRSFQHQENFNFNDSKHRLMAVRIDVSNPNKSKIGNLDITYPKNDILIDEIGGVCILDPEKRRKYFKIRATMILSLWKMSNKYFSNIYGNFKNNNNGRH